jgi:hypothetical protein
LFLLQSYIGFWNFILDNNFKTIIMIPEDEAFPRPGTPGFTKYEHMVIEFTKALLPIYAMQRNSAKTCTEHAIETANEVIKQLNSNNESKS